MTHLHELRVSISKFFLFMLSIGSVILFKKSLFIFLRELVAYSTVFLAIYITIADLSVETAAKS